MTTETQNLSSNPFAQRCNVISPQPGWCKDTSDVKTPVTQNETKGVKVSGRLLQMSGVMSADHRTVYSFISFIKANKQISRCVSRSYWSWRTAVKRTLLPFSLFVRFLFKCKISKVCACLCVWVCVCLSVCVSVCPVCVCPVCDHLSVCLSVRLRVQLPTVSCEHN